MTDATQRPATGEESKKAACASSSGHLGLALFATGLASAVAAFCASVFFFEHFAGSRPVDAPRVKALDVASISVRIAETSRTPEELEANYKRFQDYIAALREQDICVLDSRFVIHVPAADLIDADAYVRDVGTIDSSARANDRMDFNAGVRKSAAGEGK